LLAAFAVQLTHGGLCGKNKHEMHEKTIDTNNIPLPTSGCNPPRRFLIFVVAHAVRADNGTLAGRAMPAGVDSSSFSRPSPTISP